jgi:hypothetical protein
MINSRCSFTLLNNSPYNMTLDSTCSKHGLWVPQPPALIDAYRVGLFAIQGKNGSFSGAEGVATYLLQDEWNTKIRVYCDDPIGGKNLASVSSFPQSQYAVHFECRSSNDSFGTFHLNSCPSNGEDLSVIYHVRYAGRDSTSEIEEKSLLPESGDSYIKITNRTPFKLFKVFDKVDFGSYDKEIPDVVQPFESTSWSRLRGDALYEGLSKVAIVFSFVDSRNCLTHLKIGVHNPSDTAENDTCRSHGSTNSFENCTNAEPNFVFLNTPHTLRNTVYYNCSTGNGIWTVNHCEKISDVLHVDFHIIEMSALSSGCVGEDLSTVIV